MVSWFDRPVPVRLSAGLTFQVGYPERAARLLLGELKADPDTRKHRAARLALIKALETAGDQKRLLAARKASRPL
jgi:hypothetical protein